MRPHPQEEYGFKSAAGSQHWTNSRWRPSWGACQWSHREILGSLSRWWRFATNSDQESPTWLDRVQRDFNLKLHNAAASINYSSLSADTEANLHSVLYIKYSRDLTLSQTVYFWYVSDNAYQSFNCLMASRPVFLSMDIFRLVSRLRVLRSCSQRTGPMTISWIIVDASQSEPYNPNDLWDLLTLDADCIYL